MEIKITTCDYCNPGGNISAPLWRGVVMCSKKIAKSEFDWIIVDGKIMCLDCQEEKGMV